MTINEAVDDVDTIFLTDEQFETIDAYTLTTNRISDASSVPQDSDKYTGITVFYIEGFSGSNDKWTGTKA